jgi:hypothetical protein
MPRRRLAFAVRVGLPRATMNAPWRRLLPGLGGAAVMMGSATPVPARPGGCLTTPSAALATIQPALPAPNARLPPGSWPGTAA